MRKCSVCGFIDYGARPYVLRAPILSFMRGPIRFIKPDVWICDIHFTNTGSLRQQSEQP